jgi:hypothetical protein
MVEAVGSRCVRFISSESSSHEYSALVFRPGPLPALRSATFEDPGRITDCQAFGLTSSELSLQLWTCLIDLRHSVMCGGGDRPESYTVAQL